MHCTCIPGNFVPLYFTNFAIFAELKFNFPLDRRGSPSGQKGEGYCEAGFSVSVSTSPISSGSNSVSNNNNNVIIIIIIIIIVKRVTGLTITIRGKCFGQRKGVWSWFLCV